MNRQGLALKADPGTESERRVEADTSPLDTRRFFTTMTEIVRAPRIFFAGLEDTPQNYRNAWRYLALAALFHTMVSVTYFFNHKLAMAGILMINAMALPALLAFLCLLVMNMFLGAGTTFKRVFTIVAFASGTVMPVSWIPALQVFTEPIRALLVCVGLTKACGLRPWQSVFVVVLTVILFLLLMWSALPVLMDLQGGLAG